MKRIRTARRSGFGGTPTARRSLRALAAGLALATLVGAQTPASRDSGLASLSKRLQDGDRVAIDELLARTRPSTTPLTDSNARIEKLRAEIDRLNTRRNGRPILQISSGPKPVQRGTEADGSDTQPRVDALRESMAWLRAGDPERALRALPSADSATDDKDLALHLEARALEQLGRRAEALEVYRRVATSATSPILRTRAASDVAHLEWRERVFGAQEGRP